MKLAMTLRFHGAAFIGGILIAAASGYGLYIHEPIPESLGVSTPIPYDWMFAAGLVLGAIMAIRAWLKGSALAR